MLPFEAERIGSSVVVGAPEAILIVSAERAAVGIATDEAAIHDQMRVCLSDAIVLVSPMLQKAGVPCFYRHWDDDVSKLSLCKVCYLSIISGERR
jgi:hypothetical protein